MNVLPLLLLSASAILLAEGAGASPGRAIRDVGSGASCLYKSKEYSSGTFFPCHAPPPDCCNFCHCGCQDGAVSYMACTNMGCLGDHPCVEQYQERNDATATTTSSYTLSICCLLTIVLWT